MKRRTRQALGVLFGDLFPVEIRNVDIASFYPIERNIQKLIVGIEPVQDLHGYDHPWPAGGGVNLYNEAADVDGAYIDGSGVIVPASGYQYSSEIPVSVGESYTVSVNLQSAEEIYTLRIHGYNNHTWTQQITVIVSTVGQTGLYSATFTIPNDVDAVVISGSENFSKRQVEKGSSASAYQPFSNISPISGFTGLTVYRTGVNAWDEEWEVGLIDTTTGQNQESTVAIRSKNYTSVKPSTEYFFKAPKGKLLFFYDALGNYISFVDNTAGNLSFTTPQNACFVRFRMVAAYGTTYSNDISINYPSTDHDYHAYVGTPYLVSWQSEAGTVYAGTLDVVSGELTVTHNSIKVSEMVNIGYEATNQRFNCQIVGMKKAPQRTLALLSSELRTQIGGSFNINWDNCIYNNNNTDYVLIHSHEYTDVAAMQTALADVQIVYPLAAPLTYQLTPQQIYTLFGKNVLWADTGPIIELIS